MDRKGVVFITGSLNEWCVCVLGSAVSAALYFELFRSLTASLRMLQEDAFFLPAAVATVCVREKEIERGCFNAVESDLPNILFLGFRSHPVMVSFQGKL